VQSRVTVGQVKVDATTLSLAVERLIQSADGQIAPTTYRFLNAYSLALAKTNQDYGELLAGPGWNLPDGKPLSWLISALPVKPAGSQVRGPSFFAKSIEDGQAHHLRHFLLGSTVDTLQKLVDRIRDKFPEANIVGAYSPPFGTPEPEELEYRDQQIRNAQPHVVWVGLGTPKQDFEAASITDSLGVTTAAVGAAFDFLAGSKREAPSWMSQCGLEWLYRLCTEPRRLWKRYVFGNLRFLGIAASTLIAGWRTIMQAPGRKRERNRR
jgi:N-acetylglucosaminyldiphosphoundecaprenol N-acetyl-beta-D-mannosaminyltransferase